MKLRVTPQQLITEAHQKSPTTEAYRTVRTNLQFANVDRETKAIAITSSEPGEGKSSTISNLAVISAQNGKRTIIIDADLRKPQMHVRFQASNLDGLSTILTRTRTFGECVTEVRPNLFLLTSGPVPPNPSELLTSQAFKDLVADCKDEFDQVLIDTPPVLAVADAMILSQVVDGVILVVDGQKTNRKSAIRAKQILSQVHARILGVVLNRIPRKSVESYSYYYGQ